MKRITDIMTCCLTITALLTGCDKPAGPPTTLDASHRKLIEIAKEESGLDVHVQPFPNTVWIYLPLEENLLSITASPLGPQQSATPNTKPAIRYLDADFENRSLKVTYDIAPVKSYAQDYGYSSAFNAKYQTLQRQMITAISRAYSDLVQIEGTTSYRQKIPGEVDFVGREKDKSYHDLVESHVQTTKAPDFFVIVVADIVNGLETRTIVHLHDIRRAFQDPTFHEEYIKRVIVQMPTGNKAIIGDRAGSYVDYHDISWPEFVTEQVLYRVRFQYQRSSHPPTEQPQDEILAAIKETTAAYSFHDYEQVELVDLDADRTTVLKQDEITADLKEGKRYVR